MRLFFAVEFPERLKHEIRAKHPHGICGCRWMPVEQLHLTLRFLGDCGDDALPRITAAADRVRVPSFSLTLSGNGFFPRARRPSVFWLGFDESNELLQVRTELEQVLIEEGIPADDKRFAPHLTVARLQRSYQAQRHNDTLQQAFTDLEGRQVSVDSFVLFESILKPDGAAHRQVQTFH